MRKELKHYRPWLRKAIPDLAFSHGTSAHSSRFGLRDIGTLFPIYVKTHLEECTTRYLGFKCFLFSVYRVYPEVEDGRGTFDLACAFAVLFGVWKPGSVLLTAEVVW